MSAAVFIVDGDESIQRALTRLLGARDYQARVFASGEDCLKAIEAQSGPVCVLTDLCLSGMNGLELQRALPRHIPVIMLAGQADIRRVVAAMQAGAIEFLEKPVLEHQLYPAVETAIALAQARYATVKELASLETKAQLLTRREREVMALVTTGLRNKQIAHILGTVEKTIKVHRARVMEKLELDSLVEMVRCADKLGMTDETTA